MNVISLNKSVSNSLVVVKKNLVIGDLRVTLRNLDQFPKLKNADIQLFLSHLRFLKKTKQGSRVFERIEKAPFPIPVFLNRSGNNSVDVNKVFLDLFSKDLLIVEKDGLRYLEHLHLSVVTVFHELLHVLVSIEEFEKLSKDKTYKPEFWVYHFKN